MKVFIPAISAALAGATAMYFLDPVQGRRRRALVRDKVVSASVHTGDVTRAQGRRVANRMKGWAAGVRSHLPGHGATDDPRVLYHRVRSNIGRVVRHPKAVEVDVMEDCSVCLSGHILEDELADLLETVEGVPGVARVENRMMVHETAGNTPELQGSGRRGAGNGHSVWWGVLAIAAPLALLAAAARPSAHGKSLLARLTPHRTGLLDRATGPSGRLLDRIAPRRSLMDRWMPRRGLVERLMPRRRSLVARLASDRESLPALLSRGRRRDYLSALRAS